MVFKTCRFKQTVFYTLTAALVLAAFAVIVYAQYGRQLYETVDAQLIREAKLKAPELYSESLADNESIIKKVGDEYYQTSRRNGSIWISSANEPARLPLKKDLITAALKGDPRFDSVQYANVRYRVLYFPSGKDTIFGISASLEEADEQLARLKNLFLFYSPFTVLVIYSLSWLLAGRIIAPIIKMKALTEKVRQSKSFSRIEMVPTGKEIDDLVALVNEMLDSLHHSVEFQSRFTSDVSHEIRSPLTSLRGSIEVALRRERTPGEYEEILRKNLSDIFRLSKITDNLLFLARADNNILELRKQNFDVKHLLHNIVERMRYNSVKSGITLHESYSESIELWGDFDLLDQAFSNLIDNAIKYTLKGGEVTIGTRKEADVVSVVISDTGIGIPAEEIPHIFDRFHRVNKTGSKKLGGTGLGLAITRWIIDAHNGKISVKSTVGAGTEFVITFTCASG
jgi:heavy metal sensor kinase